MTPNECDGFWLVWREGGNPPTRKHEFQDMAEAEAERLARLNPGVRFYVLETKSARIKDDVRVEVPAMPIPF